MFALSPIGPMFSAASLALVGLATLLALVLLPTGSPGKEHDGLRLLMSIVGWVLTTVGGFVFFGLAMPWMLGVFFCCCACVVTVMAFTRSRDVQRQALLETLAVAAKQGLPLAPAAYAYGQETGGSVGSRARQLSAALELGGSLPDALVAVGGLVKRPTLAMLQAGHRLEVTDAALQEVAAEDEQDAIVGDVIVQALYLSGLMLFTVVVVTFLMIKIVPAFKVIFQDFEMELPAMTQVVIDLSTFLGAYGWVLFVPATPLCLALFAYLLMVYVGWVEPRVPFSDRFTSRFDAPQILRTLALGISANRPIDRTLEALAATYHKSFVRRRLRAALGDIRMGEDWCDSLYRERLVAPPDRALLKAAAVAGNLSWALKEAANNNRRRFAYWLNNVIQVLSPLVLMVMCMIVGFIVVALFMPLIRIIATLS